MGCKAARRRERIVLRFYRRGRQWEESLGQYTPAAWKAAVEAAARIARQHQREDAGVPTASTAPTLADFAARYIEDDCGHLAPTTRRDRGSYLAREGRLLAPLGTMRLDEITVPVLRAWWGEHVEQAGLANGTGRHYLVVLSQVLGYAHDLGIVEANVVDEFRSVLKRRLRTKSARAESDPVRRIRPIETAGELAALTSAARTEGLDALVFVLLGLDAGLRVGEIIGVRWGDLALGADENDTSRHILLQDGSNRPRGAEATAPKSGRARSVAMSRRLRAALLEMQSASWRPGPAARVLEGVDPSNWRKRTWRRICERAGIGQRAPKDLRDSFASHLLTLGIPLGYIAKQLGHANPQITGEHYARWIPQEYVEPLRLRPGEVPADLLARIREPIQSSVQPRPLMQSEKI